MLNTSKVFEAISISLHVSFFSTLFAFLLSIFFGYLIMATGEVNSFQSLTLAPIFLFLGYIILIPISLLIKTKENQF